MHKGPFAVISADRLLLPEAELYVRRTALQGRLWELDLDVHGVDMALGYFQGTHEVSYVAHGIMRGDAIAAGRAFQQDSVLYVSADGMAELIRCDDGTGSVIGRWRTYGEHKPADRGGWTKIGDTFYVIGADA